MQDLRYQVKVDAEANFIEGQSNPAEGRFVFTYTVKIANNGTLPAQLLHRYWKITDGGGAIREVHGDGVYLQDKELRHLLSYGLEDY